MRAFGVVIRILQCAGLYIQLTEALNVGYAEMDNHISGNGKLFWSSECCLAYLEEEASKILLSTKIRIIGE